MKLETPLIYQNLAAGLVKNADHDVKLEEVS